MQNVKVILAEQALEAERKKQRTEQRAQTVAKLRATRKELAEKSKTYDALARKLAEAIDGKNDLELEISHWREALSAMERRAPVAVKIPELSDEPDAIEHKKQYDALIKKIERLVEKRQQFWFIASEQVTAVNLAQSIQALQASERNFLRTLSGELGNDYQDERGGTVRGVA